MATCEWPYDAEACNGNGFSWSRDHNNLWYCTKHYKQWFKARQDFKKKIFEQLKLTEEQAEIIGLTK